MGFISNLFQKKHSESVVLIDISAGSVAGAYAHYRKKETPVLLYTLRLPIELHKGEPRETSMLRSLSILGNTLIREGAPILARHTGSGSAETILVSIDAPWQETKVRTESFERKTDFVFTKKMVSAILEKTSIAPAGKTLADESIIGTVLNGYETREPYGKSAHRISIIILTSLIEQKVSDGIVTVFRNLFHTKNIFSIAGSSLRYQSMRKMFPHEHDALILDEMGSLISIALIRKNLLVAVAEISEETAGNADLRRKKIIDEFTELAKQYPLPRTIFFLAQEQDRSLLEEALKTSKFSELWLSDNPPKIAPITASHLASSVRQIENASPDLSLLLMALFWQNHPKAGE